MITHNHMRQCWLRKLNAFISTPRWATDHWQGDCRVSMIWNCESSSSYNDQEIQLMVVLRVAPPYWINRAIMPNSDQQSSKLQFDWIRHYDVNLGVVGVIRRSEMWNRNMTNSWKLRTRTSQKIVSTSMIMRSILNHHWSLIIHHSSLNELE
jgi:hypothetical protein